MPSTMTVGTSLRSSVTTPHCWGWPPWRQLAEHEGLEADYLRRTVSCLMMPGVLYEGNAAERVLFRAAGRMGAAHRPVRSRIRSVCSGPGPPRCRCAPRASSGPKPLKVRRGPAMPLVLQIVHHREGAIVAQHHVLLPHSHGCPYGPRSGSSPWDSPSGRRSAHPGCTRCLGDLRRARGVLDVVDPVALAHFDLLHFHVHLGDTGRARYPPWRSCANRRRGPSSSRSSSHRFRPSGFTTVA